MENSSLGKVVGVLTAPTKTFESIAQRPTWLVALFIVVLIGVGSSFLTFTKVDGEEMVLAQIEQSGRQLSEDEIDGAVAVGEKMKYIIPATTVVVLPLIYFFTAALFLVALKIQGSEMTFVESFSTSIHGLMPLTLQALLTVPVVLAKEEISLLAVQSGGLLMSNLAFLGGDETSAATRAILGSIDIFSIWSIALLALGYAVVARVSKATAITTASLVWLLGIVIKVGGAMLGQ